MAVILENPSLLKKIILTKEYNKEGCYLVRLCHNGEWKTVMVDDLFPCNSYGELLYSRGNRNQLWVSLIEKALAKLNGSYQSLIAGHTVEGLSTLTGFPCEYINLEYKSVVKPEEHDMIWAKMLSMKESGYMMGVSCGKSFLSPEEYKKWGLQSNHAYSLINVIELRNFRLLRFIFFLKKHLNKIRRKNTHENLTDFKG
jgi:calpain-15